MKNKLLNFSGNISSLYILELEVGGFLYKITKEYTQSSKVYFLLTPKINQIGFLWHNSFLPNLLLELKVDNQNSLYVSCKIPKQLKIFTYIYCFLLLVLQITIFIFRSKDLFTGDLSLFIPVFMIVIMVSFLMITYCIFSKIALKKLEKSLNALV